MRELDQALYHYLLNQSPNMTDAWLTRRNLESGSLYSSDASPELVQKLRAQNKLFIERITEILIQENEDFLQGIAPWILGVSEDRASGNVPLHSVIEQFGIFRGVIIEFLELFAKEQRDNVLFDDIFRWTRKFNFAFDKIIDLFSQHYYQVNKRLISAKERIINELSSPIIPVAKGIGVLPLIGEIDIERAETILESVLNQTAKMRLGKLLIDLSGVREMDAMVASEISKVIKGLNLLGVQTILSGVRAEVAHAAVEQGINFRNTQIEPNLAAALVKIGMEN